MNSRRKHLKTSLLLASALLPLALSGCNSRVDAAAEAPPPANVVPDVDLNLFTVEHPDQFPLVAATAHLTASELIVTGTVAPDIARNVPVVSLASGRVVAIHARLGDTVKKGQLLLTIRSDDVAGGFDAYRKAVADELLARKQLDRAADLYAHGAIATQDLEVAQDAATDAKVTLETATEHLRLLGNTTSMPAAVLWKWDCSR
jgi:cobalt-zinc-cadmium efflux system membrane fusion protein